MGGMRRRKAAVAALVVVAVVVALALDFGRFLQFDYLKQSQASFAALYAQRPLAVMAVFFAVYVAATAV